MSMNVGEASPASAGGGHRKAILIALGIGAVIGLVFFLRRKSSATSTDNGSGQVGPGSSSDQTDLQLGNLANQLLAFRGEQSIANAGFLDRMASDAEQSALRDNTIGAGITALTLEQRNWFEQLWNVQGAQTSTFGQALAALLALHGQPVGPANPTLPKKDESPANGQPPTGAGYYGLSDALHTLQFDAGIGDGAEGMRLMSAGPVRRIA